jgi:hypothetical protein
VKGTFEVYKLASSLQRLVFIAGENRTPPNFSEKYTTRNLMSFIKCAPSCEKNSGAGINLPDRREETAEGFNVMVNPL